MASCHSLFPCYCQNKHKTNSKEIVDADNFHIDKCSDIDASVRKLAINTGAIVVASGEIDVIYCPNSQNTERIIEISGGDCMMSKITGVGCMESSLLGAFLAVDNSVDSVKACCEMMKQAGRDAAFETRNAGKGTMTFRDKLIDKLFVEKVSS